MDADKEPAKKTRSVWWRFSLREILLAMTAIAALLAVWASNRHEGPSRFVRGIDLKSLLQSTCDAQGVSATLIASAGSGFSQHGACCELDCVVRRLSLASFRSEVMPAFYSDLRRRIEESDRAIKDISKEYSSNGLSLHGFRIAYSRGRSRGVLRAVTTVNEEGQTRLFLFIDEF